MNRNPERYLRRGSVNERPESRNRRFWLASLLLLTMVACDDTQATGDDLEGDWQSRGYGMVVRFTPDEVRLIERTSVSCLLKAKYAPEKFLSRFNVRSGSPKNTFEIRYDGTLSAITFERLDDGTFGRLCPKVLSKRNDDPELNFDVLWHTFDQHYAFFSERKVDWKAIQAEFRPRIDGDTSKKKLRKTLRKMLKMLDDAHVGLEIRGDDVVPVKSRLDNRLLDECRAQHGEDCRFKRYIKQRLARSEEVLRSVYLKNGFETAFKKRAIWGRIGESTGYLRIDSMSDLARGGKTSVDDVAALEPVLDNILKDLGNLPGMIVDVRKNEGGHDTVALAIAGRFADTKRVFGSKRAFENGHRTPPQDLFVEPTDGPRYRGRVALLTSSETASAAEVFALAMQSLPQVTLVGEATMGIFSDQFGRSLPNGWKFSLSNEIYLTPNGKVLEATGVPPDVSAPFLTLEDHENGVDGGIEAAIATLNAPPRSE